MRPGPASHPLTEVLVALASLRRGQRCPLDHPHVCPDILAEQAGCRVQPRRTNVAEPADGVGATAPPGFRPTSTARPRSGKQGSSSHRARVQAERSCKAGRGDRAAQRHGVKALSETEGVGRLPSGKLPVHVRAAHFGLRRLVTAFGSGSLPTGWRVIGENDGAFQQRRSSSGT